MAFPFSSDFVTVDTGGASPDPSVVIDPVDEARDPVDDRESEDEFDPEDFNPLDAGLPETAPESCADSVCGSIAGVALGVTETSAEGDNCCIEVGMRGCEVEEGGVPLDGGDPTIPAVFED